MSLPHQFLLGAGAAIGALFGITLVGKLIDKKFNQNQLNNVIAFRNYLPFHSSCILLYSNHDFKIS
jgi:hypothetical protein